MPNRNICLIQGHLGRDIEIKHTTTGKTVANLTVATKRKFGDRDITDWVPIIWWSPFADAERHFVKGAAVDVSGVISQRSYEKDGRKVYVTEVVADHVYLIADTRAADPEPVSRPRTHKYEPPQRQAAAQVNQHGVEIDDESIPF